MDYVVGSIAALISGNVTPNRPKLIRRALTPTKHPASPNVTPKSEFVEDRSIFLSPTQQKKKAIVKKSPKRIFENTDLDVTENSENSSPKADKVKKHLKDELEAEEMSKSSILSKLSPSNKLDKSLQPSPNKKSKIIDSQDSNENIPKKKKQRSKSGVTNNSIEEEMIVDQPTAEVATKAGKSPKKKERRKSIVDVDNSKENLTEAVKEAAKQPDQTVNATGSQEGKKKKNKKRKKNKQANLVKPDTVEKKNFDKENKLTTEENKGTEEKSTEAKSPKKKKNRKKNKKQKPQVNEIKEVNESTKEVEKDEPSQDMDDESDDETEELPQELLKDESDDEIDEDDEIDDDDENDEEDENDKDDDTDESDEEISNVANPNAITEKDTDSEHDSDDEIESENEADLKNDDDDSSDDETQVKSKKGAKKKKKEAAQKTNDKQESKEDGKMEKEVNTEEEIKRTLFVGNVPFSSKCKKDIKRIFAQYGEIETVRIRTVPVKDARDTPKLAVIKNEIHPDRSTVNVYVKFADPDSVESALAENNTVLNHHHLRVSRSSATGVEHDPDCAVFLGNLPFGIEDETLRAKFEKCGDIESVRIVRDKKTNAGKGFGYVNFASKDGVELALGLSEEDLTVKNRIIRVKRCTRTLNKGPKGPKTGNKTMKPGPRKNFENNQEQNRNFGNNQGQNRNFGNNQRNFGNNPNRNQGPGRNSGNNQGPNRNFGNNQGPNRNFGNNQGPNRNFGNNQGPNRNFGNNQGPNRNFGNNQGPNRNFGNNQAPKSFGNNQNRFGNQGNDASGASRRIMNKRPHQESGDGPPNKKQHLNQPPREKKQKKEFVGMTAEKKKKQKFDKSQKKKKAISEIMTK